jgi:Peptidase A4 family
MKRFLVPLMAGAVLSLTLVGVAASAVGATPTRPNPGGLPMIREGQHGVTNQALPTYSLNWSGYAVTPPTSTSKFTSVSSTFVQPSVKCPGGIGGAGLGTSEWVGLDGFDNQTVEQDGTDAFCGGSGHTEPTYQAWYEMFPAGSVNVFDVNAGDSISASVTYKAGKFTLTIADTTSNMSYSKSAPCGSCGRASAEWINERYADCTKGETQCWLVALANFGTTTMTDNMASIGAAPLPISAFPFGNSYAIDMVYNLNGSVSPGRQGFESLDNTTAVTKANTFREVWQRSGGVTPIKL